PSFSRIDARFHQQERPSGRSPRSVALKVLCIATALAVVSTPALAGSKTHHHKHVRYHHRQVAVTDAWQPFGAAIAAPWDVQARAPRIAPEAAPGQGPQ